MTDKTERRKFLKAALAAMASAAGASTMSCRNKDRFTGVTCYYPGPPLKPDDADNEKSDRREELTEQLKKLAEEEPPKEPLPVMCYLPMIPPRD